MGGYGPPHMGMGHHGSAELLPPNVQMRLDHLVSTGFCYPEDIDDRSVGFSGVWGAICGAACFCLSFFLKFYRYSCSGLLFLFEFLGCHLSLVCCCSVFCSVFVPRFFPAFFASFFFCVVVLTRLFQTQGRRYTAIVSVGYPFSSSKGILFSFHVGCLRKRG